MRIFIVVCGLILSACTTTPDYEGLASAVNQIERDPPRECSVPWGDAVITAQGDANCDKLLAMAEADRAAKRAREVCAGMKPPQGSVSNEENIHQATMFTLCVDQVMDGGVQIVQAQQIGSAGKAKANRKPSRAELMMKYSLDQERLYVMREGNWLNAGTQLATFGIGQWASIERTEDLYNAFEAAFDAAGDTTITQSNDIGDCPEGNCSVDVGDFLMLEGNRNNVVTGDAAVANQDAKQPIQQGLNQPDSSFDPSTVNDQAPDGGPIENAPQAGSQDQDDVGLFGGF